VHGFAVAADLGRGFSSNGRANTSTIVDLKTLKPIGTVMTGGNPDAIVYLPSRKEVYTFNGTGRSATVFEAATGKVVATIALGAKPEAAVVDAAANRVFVNLEDTSSIAAIDMKTHAVVGTWKIEGCDEPTGLGYDAGKHRLLSACGNKVMAVTDSVTCKNVTSAPIGEGADGAAYDPATGYAFASNGEGTVTVAHLDTANRLTVVQTLATQRSARTMILDPATHDIYLPAATLQAPAAGGRGRPAPLPNSFKVLVYGMK
jgi:DNA-binding beta-propeller fold protein YncE